MKLRRVISLVAVLAIMLTAMPAMPLPVNAATSGYYSYTINSGTAQINKVYTSISGDVTVPSQLDGFRVTGINPYAFKDCTNITSLVIPDCVTYIGPSAFYGCSSLRSITLPFVGSGQKSSSSLTFHPFAAIFGTTSYTGSVATEQNHDDYSISSGWNNYVTYYIPSTLKSVTVTGGHIREKAFINCSSITSITLEDGVGSIDECGFFNCAGLKTVTLGSGVIDIGPSAFNGCSQLTRITLPSSVKTIQSSAFANCTYLSTVTMGTGVTEIGYSAFRECNSLTSIIIPDGVKVIDDYTFWNCYKLANVTIPNSVTSIEDLAFAGCTTMTSITIPDSVTNIGVSAFSGCSKLSSISIPDNIARIRESAFYNCNNLLYSVTENGKYLGNANNPYLVLASAVSTDATSFTFAEGTRIVLSDALKNCSKLTDLTIPDSVVYIGADALSGCGSLQSISLPFVGESRKQPTEYFQYPFGYIFGCNSYTNATATKQSYKNAGASSSVSQPTYYIPNNLKTVTVSDSDYIPYGAFSNCGNITKISLYNTTIISDYAFTGCSTLTDISIPDSLVAVGSQIFSGCPNLPYYKYDKGSYVGNPNNRYVALIHTDSTNITSCVIHPGAKAFSPHAFYNCSQLTSVSIPNGITYIPDSAFYGCSSLSSVTLPDSVTEIENYAFSQCTALANINMPKNIVSIGQYAFSSCIALTSIVIPDSTHSIGAFAFRGCRNLTSMSIPFVGSVRKTSTDTYQYPFGYIFGTASYTDGVATSQSYRGSILSSSTSTTYYIPKSLKTVAVTDGEILWHAFANCSNLTSVAIGSKVTNVDKNAFTGCNSIERIEVAPDNPYYCSASGALYNKDKTELIWAPTNRKLLIQVNFMYPDGSVASESIVEKKSVNEAYSMEVPEIPGYSPSVQRVEGTTFDEDIVINVIYYENEKQHSGTCTDSITWDLYEDGSLVFRGTGAMPDYTSGGAPWSAYADKVKMIYIDPRITSIGAYAFENCVNLTFIDYGYCVSSIGQYAFSGCTSLKTFKLPESVTAIAEGAFYGCVGLQSVVIPDNITTIGINAFYGCHALVQATIGASVTSIGINAFGGNNSLSQVYFRGEPATLGLNALGDVVGKYVYYYSTVSGWSDVITDGEWNGYTAIPYNAISKESFDGTNVYIIKVVDKHNTPLQNAVVTLGGDVQSTNDDGMAYFVKPQQAQSLSVSCSDHITFSDPNFTASSTQIMDIIELSDRPSVVQGVRVNSDSIATSVRIVNCNSDETVAITVSGYSKYTIVKYELYQGNRLIATRQTDAASCTFSVKSNAFEEEQTVFVKMHTSDGQSVAAALNIDVIKLANISEQQILQELSGLELSFSLGDMGNYKLPMNFSPSGDEKFYTSIKGRTIRVGINLDIGEFFEKNGDNAPKSALQKMVNDSMKNFAKGKSGIEYNVCGYLEIEYLGNGEYYVKTNYVKVGVATKLSFNAQASFYGIVGVYFKAGLTSESTLDITITRYEPEQGFEVEDLNFAIDHTLNVEGGAYLLWGFGSASMYGKAKMGFVLGLIPEVEFESVYITGEFGAKWSVLWGLYSGKHVIASGDIYRWPQAQTYMMRTLSTSLYAAQQEPDSYQFNDRAYLENRSEWQTGRYLQTNIYDNVAPKIVTCGNTTIMVWLDDNSERDDANFQTLYYSIYKNGTWCEPIPVADNGTFDCEFDVYTDGEQIYVVYTEMTGSNAGIETLELSGNSDLSSVVGDVEVSVVTCENGIFDAPVRLTDNDVCELLPHIAMVDGELTAMWIQSDVIGLDGQVGDNAVYSAALGQSGWSQPTEYISGQNAISDISAATLNGTAYTVYIVDADGSGETKDDQALVLCDENGNAIEADSGLITNIGYADIGGKTALTWYNNGKIYAMIDPDQAPVCLLPEDVSAGTNYQFVSISEGETLLTFVMSNYDKDGNSADGTDIYGVYVDDSGCLTAPVRLTETQGYVTNYSIVHKDGKLVTVFTETFTEVSGGTVETETHLRQTTIDFFTDIALNRVDFDVTDAQASTQLDITLDISNNGTNHVDGITVHLYDANGQRLYTTDHTVALPSGESDSYTVSIVLPQHIATTAYRVEILPKTGMAEAVDADSTDNTVSFYLAYADFSIVAEQKIIGEKNYLILSVSNIGNVSSTARIEVFAPTIGGRKITGMTIGAVAPGVTEQYIVELNALTSHADDSVSCVVTSAVDDPYQLNNTETVSLLHIDEDVFTTDPEQVIRNPEISVNAAAFDQYVPQDISVEITAEADSFTGIEGLVQNTDYTRVGNVVTIRRAYLSTLDVGEHTLTLVFDFGYDQPVARTLTVTVSDSTPVTLTGSIDIIGDATVGNTVYADTAALTPNTARLTYCWTIDGVTVSTTNHYTITSSDHGKTLTLTVSGTDGFVGEFSSQCVVVLNKPTAPSAPIVSKIGTSSFTVVKTDGVEYSLDLFTWQESASFDGLTPGTTYTVYARKQATAISVASDASIGSVVTVKKLTVAAPGVPQQQSCTYNSITLVGDPAMEYRINGGEWTDNPVFTDLEPNTTYVFHQRYKETDTTYASEYRVAYFSTRDRIYISGQIAIVGDPQYGETLTVDCSAFHGDLDSVAYQWYSDGVAIAGATSNTYTVTENEMGTYVELRIMGVGAYIGDLVAGKVIRDYVFGDVNGDLVVTVLDATILSQYVAMWDGVTINRAAADVNYDGVVNIRDVTLLRRHVAGWEGYETLPIRR